MDEIPAFFSEFARDVADFRGERIATRYAVPYMAVGDDGTAVVHDSAASVAAYFQGYLDRYRQRGCTACTYADLQVTALGARAALATLTWLLHDAAGSVVLQWRESYQLVRIDGTWKVRASIDHAV